MKKSFVQYAAAAIAGISALSITNHASAQRQMENLGRGVVAVNQGEGKVFVSWRLLGTEYGQNIGFNLYRSTGGAAPAKLNTTPIETSTNYFDSGVDGTKDNEYFIKPVINGTEQPTMSKPFLNKIAANSTPKQYVEIPLQLPAQTTPNDASVGDLDGDGEYEIILKGEQRPRDTASTGTTGDTVLQGYKVDGTLMWTIHMGKNVREGAHDTQFMVADLDGDGRAEIGVRTADGTTDGAGKVIGDPTKDWREPEGSRNVGRILTGPEYFTIFDGKTGAALASTDYIPTRDPLGGWGGIGGNGGNDSNGNRANRFLACVAYLDGKLPSIVMCRGYYGRSVLAAWDYRDGKLSSRWVFDSSKEGKGKDGKPLSDYGGMGAHGISVADVDADGKDEIVYCAMVVDDDGQGLFTTGLRHGDALHVSAFDPGRPGLQVFSPHENEEAATEKFKTPAATMYDAKTGELLWGFNPNVDAGRGVADDIDPRFPGAEAWWAGSNGLYNVNGTKVADRGPRSTNFLVYWDADPLRELLDGNHIDKWNPQTGAEETLFTMQGCSSNNGSKSTPALCADLFGDWREEVIERTTDNRALRIFTTVIPTDKRIYTLMHDPQYRMAVAWQNVAYNQPTHVGFFMGQDMKAPPKPNIVLVQPKP